MKIDTPYPKPNLDVTVIETLREYHPKTLAAFKSFQHDQLELFAKKQLAYGSGNIAMGTALKTDADIRLALTALTIRMNDKSQRLINLVVKDNKNTVPEESVIDTFMDISIYGIIAMIVNDGSWGK